ncbi:MAG: AraC family transcriptional regulator [Armatimonadetes bacterium]|nr:AraC family transcriptional regulator [Armatimonadota bacterium]
MSLNTIERTSEPRFDAHYGLELGIVLSGRMKRSYPSWEAELGPGEAWLCGIWERHGWSAAEAPCEVLVLVIRPQVLARPEPLGSVRHDWFAPFLTPPQRRPSVPPRTRQQLLAVAQQIREKWSGRSSLRGTWLRLLTFEALALIERDWVSSFRDATISHSSADISQAVNLVFSVRRLVTAEEAARACAMSGRTFRRVFEGLMGISFSRFALRHRLEGAAAELVRSDEPVKVIAASWGFADASHLHQCFVQHYGCTPRVYRQRAKPSGGATRSTDLTGGARGGRQ